MTGAALLPWQPLDGVTAESRIKLFEECHLHYGQDSLKNTMHHDYYMYGYDENKQSFVCIIQIKYLLLMVHLNAQSEGTEIYEASSPQR